MDSIFVLTLAQDAPPPSGALPGSTPNPAPSAAPTTQQPGGAPAPTAKPPGLFDNFGFMMLLVLAVVWLMILLPQRREKKKRTELMSSLKKGDRVLTVGGILASVVEVRDNEVILKLDEANNTRVHFTKAAIQTVLPEGKTDAA